MVADALPVFFIKPEQGLISLGLRELWEYRELLYFLVWRDIKVRYKQTVLGAAWAIIQPVFMMVVFSLFFGRLAKVPSNGIPYPIFVYCALLPWQLFAHALTESSNSLVANERLITKVYFPRLLVPASSTLGGLVDFAIAFVILLLMMAWYGIRPTWAIAALPGFIMLAMASALGVGLWLSALNVRYRDFRYIIPFIVQFGLYVSPVGFSSNVVPEQWRFLYSLNPMVGVIDGFRWCILGGQSGLYLPGLAASGIVSGIFLWLGIRQFRKTERSFADII